MVVTPQLQSWPRKAIPKALIVSLVLHAVVTWVFVEQPEFLFPTPPPPTPEPIPVVFVRPSRAKPTPPPELLRFDFPEAPESKEKVRSNIRSDKDRKAQTEDRSKRTAPSSGGAPPVAQPAPAPVLPPAGAPRGSDALSKPSPPTPQPTSRPVQPQQLQPVPTPTSRTDGGQDAGSGYSDTGQTAFEQQYQQYQRSRNQGLLSPALSPSVMEGPGPPGPGGNDNQGGLLSFDTQSDELGPYAKMLSERIKAGWILPNIAQTIAKGVTEVKFIIKRDGTLQDLHVSSSSGWAPLDNAALNAVRGVRPLPPLPDAFPAERVGVTFRFYVNVPLPPG